MNIILLSGGSGKRLWPLSNETRSKQFLQLLRNEDGEPESMVQRVYRQIVKTQPEAHVVVATAQTQVDSIHNQLGKNVDVVIEPERRNIFPAIALSACYLALEKEVDREETIIVLPIDTYVNDDYYETLSELDTAVQNDIADIILRGIKPTYPSCKYGYLTPTKERLASIEDIEIWGMKGYTEIEEEDHAKQLIEAGSFWNGSVYAFKLGYLLEVIEKYGKFTSYQDMLDNYGELKDNSFDYEIVDKAESVALIPYKKYWKDLGTWNTLTEEMEDESMGQVIMGEDTTNTHIINELSIPIVVLGGKNLLVAASPDGILVSDKQKSSYLKPYIDDMNVRPMFEERRWGSYKVLDYVTYEDGTKSLTKHLHMNQDENISYQSHAIRDEIWTIADGEGLLVIDDVITKVTRGDVAYIRKGQKHALRAVTNLHFIEVQLGKDLVEDDIIRYDWEWLLTNS